MTLVVALVLDHCAGVERRKASIDAQSFVMPRKDVEQREREDRVVDCPLCRSF